MNISVPRPVQQIITTLEMAHFEAFIVGGSLRDILIGRTPKDWDIATNAQPEEIQKLFPDSVYENTFGTVGVKVPRFTQLESITDSGEEGALGTASILSEKEVIEVTTFRKESGYSDDRHPDQVTFVSSIEDDLARRDFTINAIAGKITIASDNTPADDAQTLVTIEVIDPFQGMTDLEKRVLRAVGNPEERFEEDALRLIRAVRLLSELTLADGTPWAIESNTFNAIKKLSERIARVAPERIQAEFSRIILSSKPEVGVALLLETGLLKTIIPELVEGVGVTQNLHHIYTVWEHNLRALATCPSKKLSVRLATLLHDVAKPRTKKGEGYRSTFYNHDHVGARMTRKILERLRYPRQVIEHASMLVDNHLFYYNVGEVTEASVRRLIRRVGLENMDDLMAVRIGDRLGSGVPKAKPYKLRHLEYMIDKVSHDPTSVKMLKINGNILVKELALAPGPKIGALLDCLLAEVIEDPVKNETAWLLDRAKELMDNDLGVLRSLAKERIEEKNRDEDRSIRGRHRIS